MGNCVEGPYAQCKRLGKPSPIYLQPKLHKSLRVSLRQLDKGVIWSYRNPQEYVSSLFAAVGDMPQQQANAGFKSQREELSCRIYLVPSNQRGEISYHIRQDGRFNFQTMRQRQEMNALAYGS